LAEIRTTSSNPLFDLFPVKHNHALFCKLDCRQSAQWVAGCGANFSQDGSFPLLDPTTNTPTGVTMSHTALYIALYSLYMQTAAARDAV